MDGERPNIKRVDATISVDARLERAKKLNKEERYEEALAEVEAALHMDPASLHGHMAAGKLKFELKRHEDALRHFQEAIRQDPMQPKTYLRAARTAGVLEKMDMAQEYVENAIRLNPKIAIAHMAAGQIQMQKGNPAKAEQNFRQALTLDPRLVSARQRLAQVYATQQRPEEAIGQLMSALRVDPKDAGTHEGLGDVHLMQKRHTEAREAYRQAIQLGGEEPSGLAIMGLAEASIESGLLIEAEEVLRAVPDGEHSKARYHKLWGDLYYKQGLFRECVEEYNAAKLMVADEETARKEIPEVLTASTDKEWAALAEKVRQDAYKAMEARRSSRSNRQKAASGNSEAAASAGAAKSKPVGAAPAVKVS